MTFQSFERTLKQPKQLSQVCMSLLLSLVSLLLMAGAAHAAPSLFTTATQGLSCLSERMGRTNCTANDFTVGATFSASPGTPPFCVAGQNFSFLVDLDLTSNSPDRYDVGFFVGENGNAPDDSPNGAKCSVATFPTTPNPFFAANTNVCGDYLGPNQSSSTRINQIAVSCAGDPTTGNLAVPYTLVYSQNVGDQLSCAGPSNVRASNSSKCQAGTTAVTGIVAVNVGAYVDVTKVTNPTGSSQSFTFTASVPTGEKVVAQTAGIGTALTTDDVYSTPLLSNASNTVTLTLTDNQTVRFLTTAKSTNTALTIVEQATSGWNPTAAISCSSVRGTVPVTIDNPNRTVTAQLNTTNSATACTVTNTISQADLSITKTNSVTALDAGSPTAYTVVVTNVGPSAANGALFRDIAAAGLSKTTITCTATGGAVCPTAPISVATVEGATGIAIPTLPSGGSVTFTVNASVTATSGSVTNTATVTARAGVTEIDPANNTASDTDTVNGLVNITGRVFTDNSGTTAIAANAYNGIQNVGELGLAGSTVQLNNCAGTVIATTQTDGAGDYAFGVQISGLSSPNFCITQTNLASYSSVSGTTGYVRATDTITVANTGVLSYSGHNFGDAQLSLVLTTDGQQTTTPSGTVSYPHILRSDSVLDVGVLNSLTSENPTLGWTTVLYRDNNCNGTIDTGELALTSAIGQLLPNQEICVVQRVNAPANASNGAQHVATLSASYTATVQDSGVLSGSSNTRTDTTLVGTAGLDMRKQVRVVASCPSTGADVAAFSERNTAQHGDFLEYEIIYTNRSTRNLSQVNVRDFVPSSALFKAASCQSTPAGSTCSVNSQPAVDASGAVNWLVTGPVRPAATGSVRFCVQVPPLAEPPIQ